MKVLMIICQDTPEVIWNAFRLGNMMLEGMEDVSIFFNGPSVKYEESDSEQFWQRPLLFQKASYSHEAN
jgi:uncharacterized protein involved in oxidation of intracellular sulfur